MMIVIYKLLCVVFLQNITTELKIRSSNGKSLPAVQVFAKAIEFMMNTIKQFIDKTLKNPNREILWVITVPAIWSPAAKQIMRQAAEHVSERIYFKDDCNLTV